MKRETKVQEAKAILECSDFSTKWELSEDKTKCVYVLRERGRYIEEEKDITDETYIYWANRYAGARL